jgi:predicted alpha/beta hydrolase family esterase
MKIKVGGAVFVAGFFKSLTLESNEEESIAKEWLEAPVNFEKVKSHLLKSVAIFSDNDPWVPLENQDDFKNKLGSEIIIEHDKGHFSGSDGVKELPVILNTF